MLVCCQLTQSPAVHLDQPELPDYVSRGGEKLAAALQYFNLDIKGLVCADLGSHTGGFVDCLLQHGAGRVYAVDTCYGTLAWKLRRDKRVVVMERTNAMHVALPEVVDLVTVDVGWTRQTRLMPNVARLLKRTGRAVTLIKPQYEAAKDLLHDGLLADPLVDEVVRSVLSRLSDMNWRVCATLESPVRGHGGNREVFAMLAGEAPDD